MLCERRSASYLAPKYLGPVISLSFFLRATAQLQIAAAAEPDSWLGETLV